jgi:hypothetical protein
MYIITRLVRPLQRMCIQPVYDTSALSARFFRLRYYCADFKEIWLWEVWCECYVSLNLREVEIELPPPFFFRIGASNKT